MRPLLSGPDIRNLLLANAIPIRADRLGIIRSADVQHICLGELCVIICNAAGLSLLRDHVGHIIGMRSEKQMIRIYAVWIITAMKNIHSNGNGTAEFFVAGAMRPEHDAVNLYESITRCRSPGHPFPAAVLAIFIYFSQKAISCW
jgi:hypothetical protein